MYRVRSFAVVAVMVLMAQTVDAEQGIGKNYEQARWDPIHFSPQIEKATDAECLVCHEEIMTRETREMTPAGLARKDTLAWYQTLETYEGEQDTFHRRHLSTPLAQRLMKMQCTTCHQGNDPREETSSGHVYAQAELTLRKMVDPEICLMCHGQFNYQVMTGLPGPWTESGEIFQNNCMACHVAFRTHRHKVNFLNAEEIEKAGQESGDSCYGCHGGRSWYRINYPYPRHEWPGMAPDIPDWAKERPTESQARFLEE